MSPAVRVAASEADVLAVARALAGQVTWSSVAPVLRSGRSLAAKMSPPALRLLEATLARALVLALARRGGAHSRRFLPAGAPGRLWQRHAAPRFRFSPASLHLLRWLTSGGLGVVPLAEQPLTAADELLLVLAVDGLAGLGQAVALAEQPFARRSPLLQLHRPELVVDFAPLLRDEGAIVLEGLAPDLARRWTARAQDKRGLDDPGLVQQRGQAETAVLDAFMTAADGAGRRDLALWIVDAAAPLLARPLPAEALVGELDPTAPLSQRSAARRAAGGLLRAVLRWSRWDAEHRGVGFVDDGYDSAQLLLAGFEPVGERGALYARETLAELDGLGVAPREEPST
jgi:hypothetical protein